MIAGRLTVVAALAFGAPIGCGSNHHVSPWQGVSFQSLVGERGTLEQHVARIEADMSAEGMRTHAVIDGKLDDGTPFRIFGLQGQDELGRQRHAVRVATPWGVVLALGPETDEPDTIKRAQLVQALADGGGWRSGTDLNGDGMPDVVARGADGTLEVWGLHARGASPYPWQGPVAPTRALDIDDNGRPDFAGRLQVVRADPLEVEALQVMSFSRGEYRTDTPAVRAYHRARASALGGQAAKPELPVARRLGASIELAWHRIAAGDDSKAVLQQLDELARTATQVPPDVAGAWLRWRTFLVVAAGAEQATNTSARLAK